MILSSSLLFLHELFIKVFLVMLSHFFGLCTRKCLNLFHEIKKLLSNKNNTEIIYEVFVWIIGIGHIHWSTQTSNSCLYFILFYLFVCFYLSCVSGHKQEQNNTVVPYYNGIRKFFYSGVQQFISVSNSCL